MTGSKTKQAARNAAWGAIGRLVSMLLSFILRTVMIRTLGSEYLGFNSLFTSILQILCVAELGFGSAIIFSMYKPVAHGDEKTVCALLNLYRTLYRIVGVIVLGIGLALMPFLRSLIAGDIQADVNIYALYLIYLANTVSTYLFFAYRSSILVVHQRSDIPTIVTLCVEFGKTLLQIAILFTVRSYYLYVLTIPLASILSNLISAHLAKRYYPQYVCLGRVEPKMQRQIREKVLALLGVKITALIYNSVDSVVISSFLGLVALAQYNNYYFIMQAVISIIAAIYGSMQATVGSNIVTKDTHENYRDFLNLTFINAWMIGWCTVCLYCLYQPFMKIWVGEALMFENGIVICFCLYFYVFQLKAVQSTYKDAAGLWKEDLWRSYASNIVNLVCNLLLVQVIGVYGILLSTVFALLCVSYPWQTYIMHKKLFQCSMVPYLKRLVYYAAITLVVCAVTGMLCSLLPWEGVLGFILRGAVCCIVPNILFFAAFGRLKEFQAAIGIAKRLVQR